MATQRVGPVVPEALEDDDLNYFVELSALLDSDAMAKYVLALLRSHEASHNEGVSAQDLYVALHDELSTVARLQLQKTLLNMVTQSQLGMEWDGSRLLYTLPNGQRKQVSSVKRSVTARVEFEAREERQELAAPAVKRLPPVKTDKKRNLRNPLTKNYDWILGLRLWNEQKSVPVIAKAVGATEAAVYYQSKKWPKRPEQPRTGRPPAKKAGRTTSVERQGPQFERAADHHESPEAAPRKKRPPTEHERELMQEHQNRAVPPCPVHGRTRAVRLEDGTLRYRCCGRAVVPEPVTTGG